MSRSPNVTPFIPPLGSPQSSPSHPPVIPPPTVPTPSWAGGNQSPAAYPVYPSSPYAGTPFIPTMTPGSAYPPSTGPPPATLPNGLSNDYTGYPQFTPSPYAPAHGLPHQASAYPHHSPWPAPPQAPQGTPWAYPGALPGQGLGINTGGAGWMASPASPWSQGPPPWANPQPPPPPQPHAWPHPGWSAFPPPDAPPPGWPGQAAQPPSWAFGQPPPLGQPQQPPPAPANYNYGPLSRAQAHEGDRMDPFAVGDNYGPVLEPFLIRIVHAEVKVNPLITPVHENGPEKPYLKWNMLYPSSYAQRSTDPSHISWSNGRDEPATFPRVTSLRIVSDVLPWIFEVQANNPDIGVTCGEVIDRISGDLNKLTVKEDFERLSPMQRRSLTEAYRHNRSRAHGTPGGQLGQGMKRLDFLRKETTFGGVEVNPSIVRRICGDVPPCTFLLKCKHRHAMTQEEIRDQEVRQRTISQTSRDRQTRISVQPPSTADDDDDDDDD